MTSSGERAQLQRAPGRGGMDVSEVRRICARLRGLGVPDSALEPIYKAALDAECEQLATSAEDWP